MPTSPISIWGHSIPCDLHPLKWPTFPASAFHLSYSEVWRLFIATFYVPSFYDEAKQSRDGTLFLFDAIFYSPRCRSLLRGFVEKKTSFLLFLFALAVLLFDGHSRFPENFGFKSAKSSDCVARAWSDYLRFICAVKFTGDARSRAEG